VCVLVCELLLLKILCDASSCFFLKKSFFLFAIVFLLHVGCWGDKEGQVLRRGAFLFLFSLCNCSCSCNNSTPLAPHCFISCSHSFDRSFLHIFSKFSLNFHPLLFLVGCTLASYCYCYIIAIFFFFVFL
jgi:hypothetical protein